MSTDFSVERKITFQTFGKPTAKNKEQPLPVMEIIGFADSYKVDKGTYGDYPVIFGDFLARSPDGEQARAGKLIVPMFVFDMFRSALDAGETRLEIGFRVGTRPSEKGNTGYEYTVEPLFQPKPEDDPLLKLAGRAKLLAAPKGKAEDELKAEDKPKAK